MRRPLRWLPLLAASACLASSGGVARAQSKDDVARADALFNAAKALSDAGQYADACAKFAESKRLAPGLGVTLYLADCYEHLGRTASAWTEFRAAEGLARARSDKRADVARDHAQALEPKLDRLTISVAATVPRTGLTILRDGVPISLDEVGLAVPVDPGDHVVVVSSPGHASRTFSAHVGPEAPKATVTIDRLEDAPGAATGTGIPTGSATGAAPATATGSATAPETGTDDGGTRRWIGLGAMGLGVVGVGLGSVFGVLAMSAKNQSNSGPCNAADQCTAEGLSDRKDAESKATLSTIGFVAGGVLAAGGLAIYLTAPRAPSTTGLRIAPSFAAGGGGAAVLGSF